MHHIGLRTFPGEGLVFEDWQDRKIFYRQNNTVPVVVISFTHSDGEYVFARDVQWFDGASPKQLLTSDEADAVLRDVVARLRADGISARVTQ